MFSSGCPLKLNCSHWSADTTFQQKQRGCAIKWNKNKSNLSKHSYKHDNQVKKVNNFENYHYEKYEEIFKYFLLKKQSGHNNELQNIEA